MNLWLTPPKPLELRPNEVQLWVIEPARFSSLVEMLTECLSPEELAQAERFVTAQLSNNYIIAHACLRYLIAAYLKCAARDISILSNLRGKPYLNPLHHPEPFEFNMSHTRDLVMYAFAQQPVGVDVELLGREMSFTEIAERFFTQAEYQALAALPPEEQQKAFYRCWTLKEAFVKSLGHGLSYGLDKFAVDFIHAKDNCLQNIEGSSLAAENYCVQNIYYSEEYIAAFALAGSCNSLKFYQADSLDIIR